MMVLFRNINFKTQAWNLHRRKTGAFNTTVVQSGASSHAKHGGAYFSAVRGSIKDPIAVPGRDEVQEC